MQDLDDLTLKLEIEAIAKKIDAILQQVEQAHPTRNQPEAPAEKS